LLPQVAPGAKWERIVRCLGCNRRKLVGVVVVGVVIGVVVAAARWTLTLVRVRVSLRDQQYRS
jgi:hypothetical protein